MKTKKEISRERKLIRANHPEAEIKFTKNSILVIEYKVVNCLANIFNLTDFHFDNNYTLEILNPEPKSITMNSLK